MTSNLASDEIAQHAVMLRKDIGLNKSKRFYKHLKK